MGEEILRDGKVIVHRPDADEIKGIANGAWTYEQIEEYVSGLDARLDALYKASTLRDRPDYAGISNLYHEICEEAYGISIPTTS